MLGIMPSLQEDVAGAHVPCPHHPLPQIVPDPLFVAGFGTMALKSSENVHASGVTSGQPAPIQIVPDADGPWPLYFVKLSVLMRSQRFWASWSSLYDAANFAVSLGSTMITLASCASNGIRQNRAARVSFIS